MTINNTPSAVNSTAKQLFYSKIPLGARYVITNISPAGTYNTTDYVMYLQKWTEDTATEYHVTRSGSNNAYVLSSGKSTSLDIDDVEVQYPYYSYSNTGEGIYETLPVVNEVTAFSTSLLTAVVVIWVVFERLFKWRKKRI